MERSDKVGYPKINLLFSYAYLRKSPEYNQWVIDVSKDSKVIIDCGAFTVHHQTIKSAKDGRKVIPLTVSEYIDACKRYDGSVHGYIALDVIGDPKATRKNLSAMVGAGLTPMPVFVHNEDWGYVKTLTQVNPHICVGGIAGDVGGGRDEFAAYRYKRTFEASGETAQIHSLGFLKIPYIFNLPIVSGDSSSFCSGGRFGSIARFSSRTGFTTTSWQDLRIANRAALETMSYLRRFGITASDVKNPKYFKKVHGIPGLITIYAYLEFHKLCVSRGFDFYFAVPNTSWANGIFCILDTLTPRGFDYHAAWKKKLVLNELWKGDVKAYTREVSRILRTSTYGI